MFKQAWRPTATLPNLQHRSVVISKIRAFFAARGVLEVDTPLLASAAATDPHIHTFLVSHVDGMAAKPLYLQTSPEFAMKRLLASGSGSIYQICKAFRSGERGRLHNPEFTLLEWYRVGYDQHQLMTEIDELLGEILQTPVADRVPYADIFQTYLSLDPHQSSVAELQACAETHHVQVSEATDNTHEDKDFWLQLLMAHCIEPFLGREKPIFVTEYPASQAALSRINSKNPLVAERFELYFRGIELANGYYELCDAQEQRQRFLRDIQQRCDMGLSAIPIDEYFLAALVAGMPDCAGVALGIDRLIMLSCAANVIDEVMSFSIECV